MKKLIQVALLKVKLTFKDKAAFAWMFIAPFVFITVLVLGFGGGSSGGDTRYPISVVDRDRGYYSVELLDMLKNDKTFDIVESDYEKAKSSVEGGDTSMGIVIPEGFSKSMEGGTPKGIEILKLQDNESAMALTAVIGNYVYQLRMGIKAADASVEALSSVNAIKDNEKNDIRKEVESAYLENISSPKVTYEVKEVIPEEKTGLDGLSYTAIGFLIIFLMFFVSNSAGSVLEERETGTWPRMISTPTGNYSILGGYILGTFILGWIQLGVLMLTSRFLYHINWGNSLPGLVLLFSCFLLSIIGLGAALSSLVKTKAQLSTLSPIVVMPTCLLAGCMWPRELMPDFMLKISNFIPQTWVLKGMTDLVERGSDITAVYLPSAVLLVFACVFFIAGLTFMRLQNK